MNPQWLTDGPDAAPLTVVLAHGAGAAMDSPFMEWFADALAGEGFRVVRFEFPYMHKRRAGPGRPGPDRMPVLLEAWREVVNTLDTDPARTVIGGKSMGGRVASMVADELEVRGLVCLGYPFHPPGRPERLRVEHLLALQTPTLIVQGTRDTMGTADEVPGYGLAPSLTLHWLEDGDHSFKPRKRSGLTEQGNLESAARAVSAFLQGLD